MKQFNKDKSQENWELMKKWRKKATRLRRRAIRDYWKEQSNELKRNPKKFYNTFMPFLSTKNRHDKSEVSLNIQGKIE